MSIHWKKQLQQNILAILSILIAVTALSYNSWRNEKSEENRNFRTAGFEIMRESAHLQYIIDTSTYASSEDSTGAINGWVKVNLILALSELMTPEIKQQAKNLKRVWTDNWQLLDTDNHANKRIWQANQRLIKKVNQYLKSLY